MPDGSEKNKLLALIGVMSGKDEDFELFIEETREIGNSRNMYDLVELLTDAGKIELARQISGEIRNPSLAFHAHIHIASKSGNAQDFHSAIRAIETNHEADNYDRRVMMSEVVSALSKARKYKWAYSLARKAECRETEIAKIAKSALEAGDRSDAFRFAIEANEIKIAFDVATLFVKEGDIEKAKVFANKLTGICNADYYRAYAYLEIGVKTDDKEDFKKAYDAALLSCKNDSKVYSSNLMMDFALTYLNKYLAGKAFDEVLGSRSAEVATKKLLNNLKHFRSVMKKKIK